MNDNACVHFLQWALPRLNMRWKGFKRVRRQVCRRIEKRLKELNLQNMEHYRSYLETNPDEWSNLDLLCRVTISRFYRNRVVFDYITSDILPELIRSQRSKGSKKLRVWSCGCASGEEPYTISMIWHCNFKHLARDLELEIIATDVDPVMIKRAEEARYSLSSLREISQEMRARAFDHHGETFSLKKAIKKYVRFELLDIREGIPGSDFHIILCRNLAFTYFSPELQNKVVKALGNVLKQNGVLVTGTHEELTWEGTCFAPLVNHMPFYRKM